MSIPPCCLCVWVIVIPGAGALAPSIVMKLLSTLMSPCSVIVPPRAALVLLVPNARIWGASGVRVSVGVLVAVGV